MLSEIVREFSDAWGISQRVLPMSDQAVHTVVESDEGDLAFQRYFVERNCEPRAKGFQFIGADSAAPAPGVMEALHAAEAVVICPSNPWVSIAPILAVPGIRPLLARREMSTLRNRPVVAVSPIVGGKAIKGPAAKMYAEMGFQPTARAVAEHYRGLVTDFVIDEVDLQQQQEI